jgi:hypothetical protein
MSTDDLEAVIADVHGQLDEIAATVDDGDYMAFLSALVYYVARCAAGINTGEHGVVIADTLAENLKTNTRALLAHKERRQ